MNCSAVDPQDSFAPFFFFLFGHHDIRGNVVGYSERLGLEQGSLDNGRQLGEGLTS